MKQLNLFEQNDSAVESTICHDVHVWKLYTDGASRNNPGPSGIGFSLQKNDEPVCEQGFFVGVRTNNQAEYLALLVGIVYAKEFMKPKDTLAIYSDSQLLIRQMNRQYRVKDAELKKLQTIAFELLQNHIYSFCHIYRDQNSRADELANRGIDKKNPLPKKILDILSNYP